MGVIHIPHCDTREGNNNSPVKKIINIRPNVPLRRERSTLLRREFLISSRKLTLSEERYSKGNSQVLQYGRVSIMSHSTARQN